MDLSTAVSNVLSVFQSQHFAADIAYTVIRRSPDEAPIPSDKWSIMNRLIMLFHGTHDARGFKQWHEVNRYVKKGSKCFYILAPMTRKVEAEDSKDGQEHIIVIGFRPIPVFPYECTDGEELVTVDYTPAKLPPYVNVAEALGIKVSWKPICRNAYGWYSLSDKSITLCSEDFCTFYHELGHAVHSRFESLEKVDVNYAECVAETVSAVLCELNGVTGYHHQSYEYIKEYTSDKSDKATLSAVSGVLTMVEKIITLILSTAEKIKKEEK